MENSTHTNIYLQEQLLIKSISRYSFIKTLNYRSTLAIQKN